MTAGRASHVVAAIRLRGKVGLVLMMGLVGLEWGKVLSLAHSRRLSFPMGQYLLRSGVVGVVGRARVRVSLVVDESIVLVLL